jgi:hypothetical protein
VVDGYRQLDIIKDNPDWWMLELLDGFGSHVNCHEANMHRWQHKVLSLKEEGDSSHINQAYDRFTAKNDKQVHREALQWLQRDKWKNRNIASQWDLVHGGLACVRASRDNPAIWERSNSSDEAPPTLADLNRSKSKRKSRRNID